MARETPINLDSESFAEIGHQLVDDISDFLKGISDRAVTPAEPPGELLKVLGDRALPEKGAPAHELLSQATDLVHNHSLFNGHPKFMGYITSSPSPIGMLADLLAASANPNVGAEILSPIATEIEKQTVRWLAEFIGLSKSCAGVLLSGGNMANFTGFLAGRSMKMPNEFKEQGIRGTDKQAIIYCSKSTHTWIEKAAVLFGHGLNAVKWIKVDKENRMDITALVEAIDRDLVDGKQPMMLIGTAGDVSTGVVDDLDELGKVARRYDMWYHIDGAYGIPASVLPEMKSMFKGIDQADSIALDPHKWLYSPLEAGCTLVKNAAHLRRTFSSHPDYYNFSKEGEATNFFEFGLQNSRGFRALKVWLGLQQAGKEGYVEMIREDIDLAKYMYDLGETYPEIQAVTHHLSITTLRYVPIEPQEESYLNNLNEELLDGLQAGGEVFLSNAVIRGMYCLRACIVNFRTSRKDIEEILDILVREGRRLHARHSVVSGTEGQ